MWARGGAEHLLTEDRSDCTGLEVGEGGGIDCSGALLVILDVDNPADSPG